MRLHWSEHDGSIVDRGWLDVKYWRIWDAIIKWVSIASIAHCWAISMDWAEMDLKFLI